MVQRVHCRITGRVQGVCYRLYAREEAARRGLTGWVRNRSDGSVEAVAEGDEQGLEDFVRWCREGPPAARVADVVAEYSEAAGEFRGFLIGC
jgi:acylphosphatase